LRPAVLDVADERALFDVNTPGPGARAGAAQPPIALIVRAGWTKPGSLTRCLSSLRQTASRTIARARRRRAVAQRRAQVGLVQREQAGAQAAVGGQADAVAVAAERLGDRVDEADRARAVGEAVDARGRVRLARLGLERAGRARSRRGSPRR
jgi:hypothetical protein